MNRQSSAKECNFSKSNQAGFAKTVLYRVCFLPILARFPRFGGQTVWVSANKKVSFGPLCNEV